MIDKVRQWARRLKRETAALALAYCDPRTPWYAKAFALLVVAYALSPIDLIPDFIPVLGYLDDLLLLPLGIALAVRLIPAEVMQDARAHSKSMPDAGLRGSAGCVIAAWVLTIAVVLWVILR